MPKTQIAQTGRAGKYEAYGSVPSVRRWLTNLARGSPITAEVALRRLGRVCELLETTPQQLLKDVERDLRSFQDSLEDMVTRLESEGMSPGYILGLLKAVKSWLRYNDVKLTRRIKVSNSTATPTIENEQVPSQEELSRIFRASPPRIRVAEALMALADLRPETLGNHDGSDGLMIKDLPELKIKEQEEFDRALEGYAEMMENYLEDANISEIEFCPNCGSDDYDIIPIFETETQSRYKCNACGYEWVVGK